MIVIQILKKMPENWNVAIRTVHLLHKCWVKMSHTVNCQVLRGYKWSKNTSKLSKLTLAGDIWSLMPEILLPSTLRAFCHCFMAKFVFTQTPQGPTQVSIKFTKLKFSICWLDRNKFKRKLWLMSYLSL